MLNLLVMAPTAPLYREWKSWKNVSIIFHDKIFFDHNFSWWENYVNSFMTKNIWQKIFITKNFHDKKLSWQKIFLTKTFDDKNFMMKKLKKKSFMTKPFDDKIFMTKFVKILPMNLLMQGWLLTPWCPQHLGALSGCPLYVLNKKNRSPMLC